MIYRGTVTGGIVVLADGVTLADGTAVRVEPVASQPRGEPPRRQSSLADVLSDVEALYSMALVRYAFGKSGFRPTLDELKGRY